jgi:hypothetical protein
MGENHGPDLAAEESDAGDPQGEEDEVDEEEVAGVDGGRCGAAAVDEVCGEVREEGD